MDESANSHKVIKCLSLIFPYHMNASMNIISLGNENTID